MESKIKEDIYEMAIGKWGVKAQLKKAQEEATELALAIRRITCERNETNLTNLIDEIADVEIMIDQIKNIFKSYSVSAMVEDRKVYKLQRLIERINK